jgi:hypothetical protein
MGRGAVPAEDILKTHSPTIRELAQAVRGLVREIVPEAEERGNPGWHSINYCHPEVGYFFGIFPFESELRLVFEWGTRLDDPTQILEGETQRIKSVFIRSGAELHARRLALGELLKQAIGLGNDRVPKPGKRRRSVR